MITWKSQILDIENQSDSSIVSGALLVCHCGEGRGGEKVGGKGLIVEIDESYFEKSIMFFLLFYINLSSAYIHLKESTKRAQKE